MALESRRGEFRRLCEAFVTQALRLAEWGNYECVKALPEFQALCVLVQREGAIAKLRASKASAESEGALADARDLWGCYLYPLVERCSGGRFDDVYTELEPYLYADQVSWQLSWQQVAPLPGFAAQSWPVELPNGVTIGGLTEGERQRFADLVRTTGPLQSPELGLFGANFAMSWWQPVPNAPPTPRRTGDGDFDTVVTGLRLLKAGAVWYNLTGHWPGHPALGIHLAFGTAIWAPNPGVRGASYELLEQDIQPLSHLVSSLVSVAQHGQLQVALGRFNLAYERTRPEDKLVDLWIALEALFLKSDERMELTYKAALRIARFVGEDAPERVEVFERMKKSYRARSRVVHGDPPPPDVADTTTFTEEVLRKALRGSVLSGSGPDLDELDRDAVRADVKE